MVAFEPENMVGSAAQFGLYGAGVGFFVSTIQNAMSSHSRGALGVLTRTGGTIGFFSLVAASYAASHAWVSNSREVDDVLSNAAGGCVAGLTIGAKARSLPLGFASCAAMGALAGTFRATGSHLSGGSSLDSRSGFFKKQTPGNTLPSQ